MSSMLSRYFAAKALQRVIPHLKPGFQTLTRSLIEAMGDDGRARVADLLGLLFPASSTASANAALNRLITTLNDAAKVNNLPLTVTITADKKAGAAKRWVWCEGEGEGPVAYAGDLQALRPELRQTGQRAVEVGPPVVLMTFNLHETQAVWDRFGTPVQTDTLGDFPISHLGIHGGMEIWHLVSDQGSGEAGVAARYAIDRIKPWAIIAVGIAFGMNRDKQGIGDVLVSEYVRDYQLGRRNADDSFTPRSGKPRASDRLLRRIKRLDHERAHSTGWPLLHVGTMMCGNELLDNRNRRNALKDIEPETIGGEMEASGIEIVCRQSKLEWIVIKGISDWGDGTKGTSSKERDQRLAADNAALVVKALLDLGPFAPADPPPAKPVPAQPAPQLSDRRQIPDGQYQRCIRGRTITLQRDALDRIIATEREEKDADSLGIDVLPALHDWVNDDQAPPLLALLAEYGMGKTITCQQFTADLEEARKADLRRPMPLYFDLRHVTRRHGRVPTLAEALTECMERGWLDRGDGRSHDMEQIHDWIAQGAVVIIDGLDEVLVKLDAYDGQVFTNNLLKLFADTRARAAADGKPRRLKMLIACRTAYFPSLRAQQTHFTQQDRGEIDASHYRALMLLPWTEEQITRYLDAALPGIDSARVLDLIRSVHNLEELAARPFTLKLVASFIPAIEQQRAQGLPVQGVTLYRAMVQRWLERDQGKHHILPEHKMRLVAHLAAHLWQTGRNALPHDELQGWFHQWRDSQPDLRRYASMHPDQLEEDLRTATFLVRRDDGEESAFHFAHTSLLEFFLAEHLFTALRVNRSEDWNLPVPSTETLDFLGQMLAEAGDRAPLRTLEGWRRPRRSGVGELLLAYALHARKHGWPVPSLRGIDLSGANLRGWRIGHGRERLFLNGAVLTGCNLHEVVFENVDLSQADLSGCRLDLATLIDVDLASTGFESSRLTGAVFRRCRLDSSRWAGAVGYRTQYLLCHFGSAPLAGTMPELPRPGLTAPMFAPADHPPVRVDEARLAWLIGHVGAARTCAWSPDSERLVSGGSDGTLRLWDAASGESLATLSGHMGAVNACAWSPDGKRLASGGHDGMLRLWDATSGKPLATLSGHEDWVNACAWSPDGGRLVSGGDDGTLRLWDAINGEPLATLSSHVGEVTACAWSPDGGRLVSGGDDGTLRLWDAINGEPLVTLSGHVDRVNACAWSPDGGRLVSGGHDGMLRLWDAASGKPLATLSGHEDWVNACAWSPDGGRLVSCGDDRTLRLWDATSGEPIVTLSGHVGAARACAWSPDGKRLVSGGSDGALHLWDAVSGEPLTTLSSHNDWIVSCAWSPDGKRLVSGGSDGALHLWDAVSGEPLTTLFGNDFWINACAWSPDGKRLVSGEGNGMLRIWDAASGEPLFTLSSHVGGVNACAWSPDGKRLVSGGSDGALHLWDAASGKPLATLSGHVGEIMACAWSPDGGQLISGGEDKTLRLWDAVSGEPLATLSGHDGWVMTCTWSPDGKQLVSGGHDGMLRLWDATSGEPLATLSGHTGLVKACTWSPDGGRLVSGGSDGALRLWNVASGELLTTLFGHEDWIRACMWSPDGKRLASCGDDGTLRLWDVDSGDCLRVYASWQGNDGQPSLAVWSPPENRVLAATDDAWRLLGWQYRNADGRISRLPLETFGPVPVVHAPGKAA